MDFDCHWNCYRSRHHHHLIGHCLFVPEPSRVGGPTRMDRAERARSQSAGVRDLDCTVSSESPRPSHASVSPPEGEEDAAAAGGIWYLFQSDPSKPTEDAVQELTPEAAAPTNPIERAKATIDSVPDRTLDAVIDAPEVPTAAETAASAQAPKVAQTEQLKEAISEYLQNLHIGGVRTGERARIMLNGQNYDINDIVDATTGLKFIGTRNQKLLFKDPNGITYVKSF